MAGNREGDGPNDVTGNGGRNGKHGEKHWLAQEYSEGVKDDKYAEIEKSTVRGLFAPEKNTCGDKADGQQNCANSNENNCPAPLGDRGAYCGEVH